MLWNVNLSHKLFPLVNVFDSEKQKLNENVLRELFLCFVAQTWKLKQFLTKFIWVQVIVNPESGT